MVGKKKKVNDGRRYLIDILLIGFYIRLMFIFKEKHLYSPQMLKYIYI